MHNPNVSHRRSLHLYVKLFSFFPYFEVLLFSLHPEAAFCYSQPRFCLSYQTMRTARNQMNEHHPYNVTASYPFSYKCIHLLPLCVTKQHGREQDKICYVKRPTRCTFSYVFILKFALYMFRTNSAFIIRSSHITLYTAVCTNQGNSD